MQRSMRKRYTTSILLLLIAFFAQAKQGNNQPVIFRHLTTSTGLVSNHVYCILQDNNGFMWFGTDKGLNRYDGKSFLVFKHDDRDTNSLSDDNIQSLFEDSKGRIWIGTLNGLSVYDPVTEKFRHYRHSEQHPNSINKGYVAQIYEDSKGRFWICLYGGGLDLLDEKKQQFIHHTWRANDSFSIAGDKVKSIYEITTDKYLVGTFEAGNGQRDLKSSGYINCFDLRTGKFTPLNIPNTTINPVYRQPVPQMARLVHRIVPDSSGNIWFATYCGVIKYRQANKRFTFYQNIYEDSTTLSYNTVRAISFLNGKMYFGTEGGGLSVLDTISGMFTNYLNDPFDPSSLSDDIVRAVYKDKENRMWIATDGGGVNIIEPPNNNFILYSNNFLEIKNRTIREGISINALCNGGSGIIYIGTDAGLTILNTKNGSVKRWQEKLVHNGLAFDAATYAIAKSSNDDILVSMNEHIYKLEPGSLRLKKYLTKEYKHRVNRNPNDKHIAITSIAEQSDSMLLVGFFGNVASVYNSRRQSFIDILPPLRIIFSTTDKTGNIWCIRKVHYFSGGLVRIDRNWHVTEYSHSAGENYTINSGDVKYVYCDNKNTIWVATDKGLDTFERKTNRFIHLKMIAGLPDTSINCMVQDKDSNMWFLSNDALTKLNMTNRRTTAYEIYKDLPVHKPEYQMIHDPSEDAIYFTANEGIVKFYPRQLDEQKSLEPIFITGFKLFNKTLRSDSSALVKRFYQFDHDQNFITINFSATNYDDKVSYRYAYKMEGLNENWIETGTRQEADFSNLAPGKYTFQVKAASRDGNWSVQSMPVTIIVAKPWWQTTLFYSGCIAFVIISVGGYNRYRTNRFKRQTISLEQKVESRTAQYKEQRERAEKSEQFRKQFLANMSHEIRTPLHAIEGMTQLLIEKKPRQDQMQLLRTINHSSEILRHIVNDILDISKIEAGKLELEAIPFSVKETISQLYKMFVQTAREKGLKMFVLMDENIPPLVVGDPFRLFQVLMNLCSNAIKFTESGSVNIIVKIMGSEPDRNRIEFRICDTGIGIDKDKLPVIFEQFTQANQSDTRRFGGTGLGLSIARNIVSLMKGELLLKSKLGFGSEFYFSLPLEVQKATIAEVTGQKFEHHALNGLHILLADDNDYNRALVVESLQLKADVIIDIATTGEEVLGMLAIKDYDVILMDVQMPVLSGIEATRKIRLEFDAPKNNIPIIALTAGVLESEREKCFEAGMNSMISKPFTVTELTEAIVKAVGRERKKTQVAGYDLNTNTRGLTNGIDLTSLEEFCDGDKTRINHYIRLYRESVPEFINKINVAIAAKDTAAIHSLIHSFKPKLAMMGLHKILEMVKQMELETATDEYIYHSLNEVIKELRKSLLPET